MDAQRDTPQIKHFKVGDLYIRKCGNGHHIFVIDAVDDEVAPYLRRTHHDCGNRGRALRITTRSGNPYRGKEHYHFMSANLGNRWGGFLLEDYIEYKRKELKELERLFIGHFSRLNKQNDVSRVHNQEQTKSETANIVSAR